VKEPRWVEACQHFDLDGFKAPTTILDRYRAPKAWMRFREGYQDQELWVRGMKWVAEGECQPLRPANVLAWLYEKTLPLREWVVSRRYSWVTWSEYQHVPENWAVVARTNCAAFWCKRVEQ